MPGFRIGDLNVSLSPLRVRLLLQNAGRKPTELSRLPDLESTPGEALLLWMADWLALRRPVTDEQQNLLLTVYAGDIAAAASEVELNLANPSEPNLPTVQLAILDTALATISGSATCLDLRTGEMTAGPSQLPVEITSINLSALYLLHRTRLKGKDANAKPPATTAPD